MFPECYQGFIFCHILEFIRDPQRFIFNKLIYSRMSNKYISVFRNENIYIFLSLSEIYIYLYSGIEYIIYAILSLIFIYLISRIRINIFLYPVYMIYIFDFCDRYLYILDSSSKNYIYLLFWNLLYIIYIFLFCV